MPFLIRLFPFLFSAALALAPALPAMASPTPPEKRKADSSLDEPGPSSKISPFEVNLKKAEPIFDAAVALTHNRKNYAKKEVKLKVFQDLTEASDLGYLPAKCMLATLYSKGRGVKKNFRQAIELYQQVFESPEFPQAAAKLKDWRIAEAKLDYARILNLSKDAAHRERAIQIYENLVETKTRFIDAGTALISILEKRKENPVYFEKLISLFEKLITLTREHSREAPSAYERHYLETMIRLYQDASEPNRNPEKLLQILLRAADLKSRSSLLALAEIYEEGRGVPKDLKKSVEFLERASAIPQKFEREMTQAEIYRKLGDYYRDQRTANSITAAIHWYKSGINLGDLSCKLELAHLWRQDPVHRNQARAFYQQVEQAALTSTDAEFLARLGLFLLESKFNNTNYSNMNYPLLEDILKRAAEQGHTKAVKGLIRISLLGIGISHSKETILKWIKKAATLEKQEGFKWRWRAVLALLDELENDHSSLSQPTRAEIIEDIFNRLESGDTAPYLSLTVAQFLGPISLSASWVDRVIATIERLRGSLPGTISTPNQLETICPFSLFLVLLAQNHPDPQTSKSLTLVYLLRVESERLRLIEGHQNFHVGQVWEKYGNLEKAKLYYERAIQKKPHVKAYFHLGRLVEQKAALSGTELDRQAAVSYYEMAAQYAHEGAQAALTRLRPISSQSEAHQVDIVELANRDADDSESRYYDEALQALEIFDIGADSKENIRRQIRFAKSLFKSRSVWAAMVEAKLPLTQHVIYDNTMDGIFHAEASAEAGGDKLKVMQRLNYIHNVFARTYLLAKEKGVLEDYFRNSYKNWACVDARTELFFTYLRKLNQHHTGKVVAETLDELIKNVLAVYTDYIATKGLKSDRKQLEQFYREKYLGKPWQEQTFDENLWKQILAKAEEWSII